MAKNRWQQTMEITVDLTPTEYEERFMAMARNAGRKLGRSIVDEIISPRIKQDGPLRPVFRWPWPPSLREWAWENYYGPNSESDRFRRNLLEGDWRLEPPPASEPSTKRSSPVSTRKSATATRTSSRRRP